MSGTLALVGTCLALGLSQDETAAVWEDLKLLPVPDADPAAVYRTLVEAIRKVKPSAVKPDHDWARLRELEREFGIRGDDE